MLGSVSNMLFLAACISVNPSEGLSRTGLDTMMVE